MDTNNLIKSEQLSKYSNYSFSLLLISLTSSIFINYMILFSSIMLLFVTDEYKVSSLKYKKMYLDDNSIGDDINKN